MIHEATIDAGTDLLVSMGAITVGSLDLGTLLAPLVRRVPRIKRFLPVLAFDVDGLDTFRPVNLPFMPATSDQVSETAFDVLAVVLPCCTALLHGRDCVEALLQKVAELRLVHLEHHVVECALFEVPLYNRPQTFDTVQFGAVRGHEKQLDLQVRCPLPIDQCPVRRGIVNHDVKLRVANEEPRAQGVEESGECLAVCRFFLREHCSVEA